MQFQQARVGAFLQSIPRLENPYLGDAFLRRILARLIPQEVMKDVDPELTRFGERIRSELEPLSVECEENPPQLVHTDAWGKRVDSVVTCHAWRAMKGVSAEEGLIAIPYERKFGDWSRLVQFAKLYLYSPSSGLYTCPLAMTDGAAKTIKELKLSKLDEPFRHLTSRTPKDFWTSGQWMTEKRGGSDVGSGTETLAVEQPNGKYLLYGYKWFSSATDSDMTFTLARITDANGVKQGSAGLSMFFVKTRNDDNSLNNIHVMKLKNKLGTRQLPTGELLLDGTVAELASEPGRGVASISNMLTITRIHNSCASVAAMRRIISLSRDYSQRRTCFGQKIFQFPLHIDTLAELELQARGGVSIFLEVVRLLGAVESTKGTEDDKLLLRLLTPIIKLYTGKKCIGVVSEGLESFGGQGYIEDTGIPKILRDAQVTPIWEGTTNILSLDVLRAIGKSKGEVLLAFQRNFSNRLVACKKAAPQTDPEVQKVSNALNEIIYHAGLGQISEVSAREFAFSIAEVTIGTLLLEQSVSPLASLSDRTAARRWVQQMSSFQVKLNQLISRPQQDSADLVFDGYTKED